MSNTTVDSIVNDSEIAKLNSEIKKILDSLTSYYRIIDNTETDIEGVQNSIDYHEAELELAKAQYQTALCDACDNKKCASNLTSNAEYLKCAGECQQHQEAINRFKEQIKESIDRKERMTKMISNFEKQLQTEIIVIFAPKR